ncbi:hypothetical protein MKZ38_002009 [Zalerion maritima]|uniref:Uncharacterized protein n=1 Tax=Zalerion maritima TaxID=339359 RepID=A0AAD5WR31_9PEZI|nr:hypothetical protein MKZ38_002009 [Zalerion maritima]
MERRRSPGLAPRHDSSGRVEKAQSSADKLAALKARVSAAVNNSTSKRPTGGLNVSLHPALEDLGQWKAPGKSSSESRSTGPASSSLGQRHDVAYSTPGIGRPRPVGLTTGANGRHENPYFDPNTAGHAPGKQRQSRQLIFNQKGKYIQQANALRRQAALEAMKKRIAEQTRKAGIDDDRDIEENFLVPEPPAPEWWDESLIDGKSYEVVGDESCLKLTSPDSIITEYVQHPVALEPPQEKNAPAPKPMYLTSKEQAKLRRQRRMAALKEQQAKIRLGLEPAPPPKVKKGNLMRVLGEEAVKDPTAVEARVNREIAERLDKHIQINEERKLTKEGTREKIAANQAKDAAKGIRILVFKINSLANGQHRYKIGINAEQLALTGTCIMHPRFCLVIVEGGEWAIKKYKKLMLNRIDWNENAPSRDGSTEGKQQRDWLKAEDEKGELKDMSTNACTLIFEGEVKAAAFRKWGSKICETDAEAREALSRVKMENFWQQARAQTGVTY